MKNLFRSVMHSPFDDRDSKSGFKRSFSIPATDSNSNIFLIECACFRVKQLIELTTTKSHSKCWHFFPSSWHIVVINLLIILSSVKRRHAGGQFISGALSQQTFAHKVSSMPSTCAPSDVNHLQRAPLATVAIIFMNSRQTF